MAVALQTHQIASHRASVHTTYRSGGAGGRVSSVRSASNPGHLRLVAGSAATSRPVVAPAVYRRRRLVVASVFAALIGVVAGVGLVGKAEADRPTAANMNVQRTIVARPGETLWAIAKRIAPNANVLDVVDELVRLNGQTIRAGQIIHLPR